MSNPSNRQLAIAELRRRLRLIRTTAGYQTDVGESVLLCERPSFGPDDPTAVLNMAVLDDEYTYQGENVSAVVPVRCEAIVKADADDPWVTVEAVIADIKTAVETDWDLTDPTVSPPKRRLIQNGLSRQGVVPLEREEGSEFVGAGVVYLLHMKEKWGDP